MDDEEEDERMPGLLVKLDDESLYALKPEGAEVNCFLRGFRFFRCINFLRFCISLFCLVLFDDFFNSDLLFTKNCFPEGDWVMKTNRNTTTSTATMTPIQTPKLELIEESCWLIRRLTSSRLILLAMFYKKI